MDKITRLDFINGTLMVAWASMLPSGCASNAVLDSLDPLYYPPSLTGLRGSPQDQTPTHMPGHGMEHQIGAQRLSPHIRNPLNLLNY